MGKRILIIFAVSWLMIAMTGCRALDEGYLAIPPQEQVEYSVTVGRVRQVRRFLGYVVLECVSLPSPGERLTVYREAQPVAQLRVTRYIRMPFAAADIESGVPQVNDKVKAVRFRMTAAQVGRKSQ